MGATNGKKKAPSKKATKKKEIQQEDLLKRIKYFHRPQLVNNLWKFDLEEGDDEREARKNIKFIGAKSHFCYAIAEREGARNEIYSWGLGENFVLCNAYRSDEGTIVEQNEFFPFKVDGDRFQDKNVQVIGCGINHIVALATDSPDQKLPLFSWEQV